jgi:protein-S-isoprenylcysteine O-methyltransferase Ste14
MPVENSALIQRLLLDLFTTVIFLSLTLPAQAYIGPGAGISAVGSLLGLLGTVLLAVGVILLWPIRRLLNRKKSNSNATESQEDAEIAENSEGDSSIVADRVIEK